MPSSGLQCGQAQPADPIVGRHPTLPPPPELVEGEEEYLVKKILDSKMFCGRKLSGKVTVQNTIAGNMRRKSMHLSG